MQRERERELVMDGVGEEDLRKMERAEREERRESLTVRTDSRTGRGYCGVQFSTD